jgi:alanyl-tRNA synthetase
MMSNPKKNKKPVDGDYTPRMKQYSAANIAATFLDFYRERGHTYCPSSPLVPEDPTLLFTAAGMVPFKAYYSDPDRAPYPTATSVQKCLRAGGKQSDLENVGRTLRHHTFFEMLGNFSFGDYFKKEAIDTAWELSVDVWKLDPALIWISIHQDDDEAFDLWSERIGVPKERIVRLGKKDNFWGPVGDTGVCGPSSELHYDTGAARSCGRESCQPGCDCDRYIEFWNLVFPQFFFTEQGNYDPLPRPGIDTGMGLERVAFLLQRVKDNFHTDLFLPIRDAVKRAFPKVQTGDKAEIAVNVASDHARALVFALAEGIMPSNEGRGYVLRRLLRRALTKMHPFGVKKPFMSDAVDAVIRTMGVRYPELEQRASLIKRLITAEEEHFLSTIDQGWNRFQEVIERSKMAKTGVFPGKEAFTLYDTFGFPPELTSELALDAGLTLDEAAYETEMAKQKTRSRKQHKVELDAKLRRRDDDARPVVSVDVKPVTETEFLGHDELVCDANFGLVEVFEDGEQHVIEATTDRTVFYPESGGQIGDTGAAKVGEEQLDVVDAFRRDNQIVHRMQWRGGRRSDKDLAAFFKDNPATRLEVDRDTRMSTARNHTATHLLHAALRRVLGDHVAQAGSLVAPDRLRFDFHHFQAMTPDEIDRVEQLVNGAVMDDLAVETAWLPREQAFAAGAMALFGEKYADTVRVVSVDAFSKELCGGTHLRHTGEIGLFAIRQETSVAAGIRRIEALTGWGARSYFRQIFEGRTGLASQLKVAPDDLDRRVQALVDENEELRRRLNERESEQAVSSVGEAIDRAEDVGGTKLATFETDTGDLAALRQTGDHLRGKIGLGVGLLCLTTGKKPIVLVVVSDDLIRTRQVRANDIARRLAEEYSLRGGGKDHLAQLGINDKSDFKGIVSFVRSWLEGLS